MIQKAPIATVLLNLVIGLLFLAYQHFNFTLVDEIDFYSLASEGGITITLLFILLNLHRLHHKDLTFYYMNLGFSMLFISLLTDTSDEVFEHPYLVTTLLEDIMQVLGFIIVFIGLRKWMKYNDRQNEELITLATTDELTGLYVRRFFLDKTQDEFNRSQRNQVNFSILMIDIDHFKSINDKFSHAAGDRVLQVFAREIKGSIRKTDVIARWGGEEFVVLLVHDDVDNIKEISSRISEKIRSKTEGIKVVFNEEVINFTVSIGATISAKEDPSIDVIIDRADKLLYQAKIKGRNCVALDLFKSVNTS